MCSPFWTPLPIPSLSQSHPNAPALSTLSHASNLDWRSVSYMIIYKFICYSLKSSHPFLLPQSPEDYSIHLCLFCCLTYRVIVNHLSKFHIYALVYCASIHFKEHFRIDDLVSPSPLQPCTENTSLVVQRVKNLPAMPETRFEPWVGNPLQYSCLEDSKCTEGSGGL